MCLGKRPRTEPETSSESSSTRTFPPSRSPHVIGPIPHARRAGIHGWGYARHLGLRHRVLRKDYRTEDINTDETYMNFPQDFHGDVVMRIRRRSYISANNKRRKIFHQPFGEEEDKWNIHGAPIGRSKSMAPGKISKPRMRGKVVRTPYATLSEVILLLILLQNLLIVTCSQLSASPTCNVPAIVATISIPSNASLDPVVAETPKFNPTEQVIKAALPIASKILSPVTICKAGILPTPPKSFVLPEAIHRRREEESDTGDMIAPCVVPSAPSDITHKPDFLPVTPQYFKVAEDICPYEESDAHSVAPSCSIPCKTDVLPASPWHFERTLPLPSFILPARFLGIDKHICHNKQAADVVPQPPIMSNRVGDVLDSALYADDSGVFLNYVSAR